MTGIKYDQDKPPLELIPSLALEEVAKVLGKGKVKYTAWNWASGFEWSRLIGSCGRHLGAFQRGEDLDPESKLSHMAHLACTALFLLEHELRGLGVDDRYKFSHTNDTVKKSHEDLVETVKRAGLNGIETTTTFYPGE